MPPVLPLNRMLPPPRHPGWRPDATGMAYLETSRGCPFRCTYCRYHHFHDGVSALSPAEVVERVKVLYGRGAREIRFIDPTFNAHPAFDRIVEALAAHNRDRQLHFFAEVMADRLSPGQIRHLAAAGFRSVEVGVQSRSPAVLRAIKRPAGRTRQAMALRRMGKAGIKVTLDLMYGLPGQTPQEVLKDIRWAARLSGVQIQCLQTLLLPGTDLGVNRQRWGMSSPSRPPYGVNKTSSMTFSDMAVIEQYNQSRWPLGGTTRRFVGTYLSGLFPEKVRVPLKSVSTHSSIPGSHARRALVVTGYHFFEHSADLAALIGRAITREPFVLWQFVLALPREEPLDLFDLLVAEIRRHPRPITDRYAAVAVTGRLASRRLLVQLSRGRSYDAGWIAAVASHLSAAFF